LLRSSKQGDEVTLDPEGRLQSRSEVALRPEDAPQTDIAAGIVDRAQERADEVLRSSAERAAAVEHEAYREGREHGYQDGIVAARAELVEALTLVQQAGREAKTVRDRLLADAEREAVALVIASVEAILGEQTRIDPALVLDTVERALKRAGSQNVLRIRVNPEDRELVDARLVERVGEAAAKWEVTTDGAITVGGCIVDTERGEVDARLDVQLEEIARVFRSAQSIDAGAGEERAHAA
jgi:flagellar assembly protein FliH